MLKIKKVRELLKTWKGRSINGNLRSIINILQGKELEAYEE